MPQVLIVHGWSDTYESFEPLKDLLVAAGYQTTQVFLGTYASMRDDVTFDDLATEALDLIGCHVTEIVVESLT